MPRKKKNPETYEDYFPMMLQWRKLCRDYETFKKQKYEPYRVEFAQMRRTVFSMPKRTTQRKQAMEYYQKYALPAYQDMRQKMKDWEAKLDAYRPIYKAIPQPFRQKYWELYKRAVADV